MSAHFDRCGEHAGQSLMRYSCAAARVERLGRCNIVNANEFEFRFAEIELK